MSPATWCGRLQRLFACRQVDRMKDRAVCDHGHRGPGSTGGSMASNRTFVIVGASLAGAKAAETLRTEGFVGRIVLIGDEAVRPYERPPLSKDYLRGEKGFDSAAVHDEDRKSTRLNSSHLGIS